MGKIIWLASYPRSGNTWMRAFLYSLLSNPEETYDLNTMWAYSMADSDGPIYQQFLDKPVKDMTDEEISILRPKVQEHFTRRTPGNVFVKTHNAFVEYLGRPLHYREYTGGAIYIVRNPLDMVISHSHHYGLSLDETIANTSREVLRIDSDDTYPYELHCSWSRNVESWTRRPSPTLHVIRYEDMVARPTEAFGGLAQFLGQPPQPARLRSAIELSSFEGLRKKEEEGGFVERSKISRRFFRQGKAGAWRAVLTPAQVQAVVAAHETQMRRFGYWPVADWPA
jgi:hypothetical protein